MLLKCVVALSLTVASVLGAEGEQQPSEAEQVEAKCATHCRSSNYAKAHDIYSLKNSLLVKCAHNCLDYPHTLLGLMPKYESICASDKKNLEDNNCQKLSTALAKVLLAVESHQQAWDIVLQALRKKKQAMRTKHKGRDYLEDEDYRAHNNEIAYGKELRGRSRELQKKHETNLSFLQDVQPDQYSELVAAITARANHSERTQIQNQICHQHKLLRSNSNGY